MRDMTNEEHERYTKSLNNLFKPLTQKQFNICVDDDCVEILDWINNHFRNGNYHKNFEITLTVREIDYTENGDIIYVD